MAPTSTVRPRRRGGTGVIGPTYVSRTTLEWSRVGKQAREWPLNLHCLPVYQGVYQLLLRLVIE